MAKTKKYTKWSKRIERNILTTYNLATKVDHNYGMHWYAIARDEALTIAEKYDVGVDKVVGVIAAISPGLNWGRNLIEAAEVVRAFATGQPTPMVGVYGKGNVAKAVRILKGENAMDVFPVKTSPKVRSFYDNILYPRSGSEVCIDRHAKALAYNYGSERAGRASDDKLSAVRPREYQYLAWHYRVLAGRLGLIPSQLQAICWVTWKRIDGDVSGQNYNEVPF